MSNPSDLFEGGLETNYKRCSCCGRSLPFSEFNRDSGANYLRYECKRCAKEAADLLKLLKKTAPAIPKDHRCPICDRNEEELKREVVSKKKSVWTLDHDHKTKKFRGWLCGKCNLGLGNMADDPNRLERGIKYLNE